ncbi:MAG TPA: M1 family metallopeptidase [Candidatus Paceibacterota bacterium]|jgi:puromycin-sensitive aminopeptidase|nr:M1 family metallopeptidase [Candidatus Paceibacterota bacterium]
MESKNVRLSKNVTPIDYKIQLKPDLENFTFAGVETISLKILKATKALTLHSKEIEIDTADVKINGKKIFAKIFYDTKKETATFIFSKSIPAGKAKLVLVFRGILNDKMRGFYRSKYLVGGKEYHMATTQFEATDARRAFPCFDEPARKAVFHVSLIVPQGKTALSNTLPISSIEHEAGYDIVKFSPTPKMSTYLLAFIVGDFEYLEKKAKSGTRIRVYTTPSKKNQAKFALDCTVKTLEFYERYFNIKYPLPVLDMIAIPDFASGAMENWGAITYRESALLVDEEHSSASNKQWVALVIAHELAHQWFGNLVTMEWWTHLWLNEGFASYIEYLAVDKLFPEWDIWTQFSTNDLGVALRLDALMNTHPIEVEVHHPSEMGEIFDEVSYSKGASVIRMLADYLGEKDFRDGLSYYLKKHSYKNTETIHLWQAFERVSKKPVAKMMHNWTSKPGYPVIKAMLENGKLELSQERFFTSPLSKKKNKIKTQWEVPILIVEQEGWTKVNIGESGFYRTAYSRELLGKLVAPVQNKILSARDRLGIVRDLFALAEAGTIATIDALEFVKAYKKEDNYTVWLEIAMGLARIEQLLKQNNDLNKFVINLLSPTFKRLGWNKKPNESHADTLLRSLAISRLGRSGDKRVIAEARKRLKSGHAKGRASKINPDLRGAVYGVVASAGNTKEYNTFIKLYKAETLHEEQNRIGSALGDFKNPKILQFACEFAMSENVRTQDTVSILSSVGANPMGRDIWWNFLQKNWKTLVSRYGEGGLTLGRAVKAIGRSAEEKHLKSIIKFFKTHQAPGAKRSIDQVIERLEGNVAWLKRDRKKIEKFLKNPN